MGIIPTPRVDSFTRAQVVLLDLSAITSLAKSLENDKRLKKIAYDVVHARAWADLERGCISLSECQHQLQSNMKDVTSEDVQKVTELCLERSFESGFKDFVKNNSHKATIHIIGNTSSMMWSKLRPELDNISAAIQSHLSYEIGARLSYPAIFDCFLKSSSNAHLEPSNIVFVTASVDAHISARATNFSTLLIDAGQPNLERNLRLFVHDPLFPAREWLQQHAENLDLEASITSNRIRDFYIQCLILELTGDPSLLYPEMVDPTLTTTKFSWFVGSCPAGLWDFPPCLETNSLAYLTLPRLASPEGFAGANNILNEMLQCRLEEGSDLLNAYMNDEKVRFDLMALSNALAMFYAYGRGNDVQGVESFLLTVLRTGAYENGSHYYTNPDFFLFNMSRLLVLRRSPVIAKPMEAGESHESSKDSGLAHLRTQFLPIIKECVLTHTHTKTDALGLACRVIAGARCGLRLDDCLDKLLALQCDDGSWPVCVIYKFNRLEGSCWHQGLTTTMAVRAIGEWENVRRLQSQEGELNNCRI